MQHSLILFSNSEKKEYNLTQKYSCFMDMNIYWLDDHKYNVTY